jgi:hypothetical protein
MTRCSGATGRARADPRRGRESAQTPAPRPGPNQPGSSTLRESIGGALPRHGSRRGPRPSCAGKRPDPAHARAAGETDASPENVAAVRSHRVHSTACSNGVAERFVGTVRRDLLNHAIVLDDEHLRRLLSEHLAYSHGDRTHLGIEKDAPVAGPVELRPPGAAVQARRRVGGLYHRYEWAAAAWRGRLENKDVRSPVPVARVGGTGSPDVLPRPTSGCRGRRTPCATLVFGYRDWPIEHWRGTAMRRDALRETCAAAGGRALAC